MKDVPNEWALPLDIWFSSTDLRAVSDVFPADGLGSSNVSRCPIKWSVGVRTLTSMEQQNRSHEGDGSAHQKERMVALNTHGAKVQRLMVHFSSLVRNLLPEERLNS